GERTLVRLAPADMLQGDAAVELARDGDARKLFVVSDGRPWGEAIGDRAQRVAEGVGLPVARRVRAVAPGPRETPCPARHADRELWRSIRAAGADAVFFAGTLADDPVGFVCAERATLGDDADGIQLIGSDRLYQDAFVVGAGKAAEGVSVLFGAIPADRLASK